MSIPSNCLLCGAEASRQSVVVAHVYGDGSRAVFHCSNCDVRYQYPPLTSAEEAKLYAAEFEKYMTARSGKPDWTGPEQHIVGNEQERIRRMRHFPAVLGKPIRILEIGCGSGFMLYPLRDAGHECVAVEPSGVFADYIQKQGLECHSSLADVQGKFDLILHYYVMEHLANPVGFLKQQIRMLRPSGHILFEVPNVNDALMTIYKIPEYDRFIWQIAHRWYFSAKSLANVLDLVPGKPSIHFDQRYDLSNHIIWARDGKPGGMARFTDILGYEIEDLYRKALIASGRYDTLIGRIEVNG